MQNKSHWVFFIILYTHLKSKQMSTQKKLVIGLFGFGVVGEGLYLALNNAIYLDASIKKVCIKDADKQRNAPARLFTTNPDELLDDPEINVIVEVINDTAAAKAIALKAIASGKQLVSASKKFIAENLQELIALHSHHNTSFLYESSVCASIPVIRNLEEYYNNDFLQHLSGIINGSTNFILHKVFEDNLEYADALRLAQDLGFAELDPALDVQGTDALHKLIILLAHAFGIIARPDEILVNGIRNINGYDVRYAKQHQSQIKLVAQARPLQNGDIAALVLPTLVRNSSPLSFVKEEYNGVLIRSSLADEQFFYGKGAGSFPTASAVLSDIAALSYGYKYEYHKLRQQPGNKLADDAILKVYVSHPHNVKLPLTDFRSIQTIHDDPERSYIIGEISYSYLLENDWWQSEHISLLLFEDGITEKKAPAHSQASYYTSHQTV